jgi:hypothetical protein
MPTRTESQLMTLDCQDEKKEKEMEEEMEVEDVTVN